MADIIALFIPIIALLLLFGKPVFRMLFDHLEKVAQLKANESPKLLEAWNAEREELQARIQNLESIVCSVDFELNQRLNRLSAEASQAMLALKAAPAASATVDGVATRDIGPVRTPAYHLGHLANGQVVLDRYTIERELGRGGMGAVYLAWDAKLGERVALKTLSSVITSNPQEVAHRLRLEVQAARRVTHPNVVRIHDLGEDGPLLFLSMEYVPGESLQARIEREGALPVTVGLDILTQVASGVAAAHAAGVVHRDVKPHNVLLCTEPAGLVKVIDFGIAWQPRTAGMTATGIILGTPEYMAPEQIRGERVDARTDVYAMGVLAYRALCGVAPFKGDTPIAVGFAQLHDEPPPLRSHVPEIPPTLEAAVLKALAKKPQDRFTDARAFGEALGAQGLTVLGRG